MMPEDDDENSGGLAGWLVLILVPSVLIWAHAIYGFLCRYVWF